MERSLLPVPTEPFRRRLFGRRRYPAAAGTLRPPMLLPVFPEVELADHWHVFGALCWRVGGGLRPFRLLLFRWPETALPPRTTCARVTRRPR